MRGDLFSSQTPIEPLGEDFFQDIVRYSIFGFFHLFFIEPESSYLMIVGFL